MLRYMRMVEAFHRAYGLPVADEPQLPDEKTKVLRMRLLEEEFKEYLAAEALNDMPAIADGLADLLYIAIGTALCYGIPLDRIFEEVHAANMRKLGEDGKPIIRPDGKVLKPDGWTPPDIEGVLRKYGWRG